MTNDPRQIRSQVDAMLAELPSFDASAETADIDIDVADIDTVGHRLEQAHQILVDALESVEKG